MILSGMNCGTRLILLSFRENKWNIIEMMSKNIRSKRFCNFAFFNEILRSFYFSQELPMYCFWISLFFVLEYAIVDPMTFSIYWPHDLHHTKREKYCSNGLPLNLIFCTFNGAKSDIIRCTLCANFCTLYAYFVLCKQILNFVYEF